MKEHTLVLILLLITPLQAACVAPAQREPASSSITSALKAGESSCPSQDFSVFLQRFADSEDDSVRSVFTADPVAYEVLFYTVAEATDDSPEMFVSQESGEARLDYFRYRYFRAAGDYDRVYNNGNTHVFTELENNTSKYPVHIKELPGDGREVVFGTEYEIDIYQFQRARGCWYLMRIINPND